MNIEAKNLSKIYGDGENRVVALDHANLEIVSSDFISIMGPSGSGKSTLLHLLSGLDNNSKIQSDVRYFLSSIFLIPFLSLFFTYITCIPLPATSHFLQTLLLILLLKTCLIIA